MQHAMVSINKNAKVRLSSPPQKKTHTRKRKAVDEMSESPHEIAAG